MFEGEKAICFSGTDQFRCYLVDSGVKVAKRDPGNGAACILGWTHVMVVKGLDLRGVYVQLQCYLLTR